MAELKIVHRTVYDYRVPVLLGAHRFLLRPRESRELRVVASDVHLTPQAEIRWASDVLGNAVASSVFNVHADNLIIESVALVQLSAPAYPVFDIAVEAIRYPFRYSDDDRTDLRPFTVPQFPDSGQLKSWARKFVPAGSIDTLSLLKDVNVGVAETIAYEARESEGTQSPQQTLELHQGSCRDLATLFVEAVRSLGFGARIVSGYLHDPSRTLLGSIDSGSTHAWAETYVPGAGWITFDPTNRRMGGGDLIPVAVARSVQQVIPIVGSYNGPADALQELTVEVSVSEERVA